MNEIFGLLLSKSLGTVGLLKFNRVSKGENGSVTLSLSSVSTGKDIQGLLHIHTHVHFNSRITVNLNEDAEEIVDNRGTPVSIRGTKIPVSLAPTLQKLDGSVGKRAVMVSDVESVLLFNPRQVKARGHREIVSNLNFLIDPQTFSSLEYAKECIQRRAEEFEYAIQYMIEQQAKEHITLPRGEHVRIEQTADGDHRMVMSGKNRRATPEDITVFIDDHIRMVLETKHAQMNVNHCLEIIPA
ncbi:hypothetical protein RYA05_01250 [Pseudomonas syringae pv. actinidiae]|nr:hypothetical protein [Pseudomonas syringae pv. actinidiae]